MIIYSGQFLICETAVTSEYKLCFISMKKSAKTVGAGKIKVAGKSEGNRRRLQKTLREMLAQVDPLDPSQLRPVYRRVIE
jgi:hypothetical protein